MLKMKFCLKRFLFCRFAAHTLASKSLVLVTIKVTGNECLEICVNCEKMVIGSILLTELKSNLKMN